MPSDYMKLIIVYHYSTWAGELLWLVEESDNGCDDGGGVCGMVEEDPTFCYN